MRKCCVCGLVFPYAHGFGSHMLYHERRGEATRTDEDGKALWRKVTLASERPQ